MTSRERLLITLQGGIADRVPVAPFVQEEYLSFHYPDRPSVDRVIDATDLANDLDFDLMARHRGLEAPHFFRRSHRNWELRRTEAQEDGMEVRRFQIVTPSLTLTKEDSRPLAGAATAGLSFTPTKPLLSGREEIECFLEHLPALDDADRAHIRETVAGWKRVVDDRGILAPWGFAGVFNVAAELAGMDSIYVMPYEDEPLYRHFADRLAAAESAYNVALAEAGVDCVGFQGHIAGGESAGPEYFRAYVQEYEKRVVDAIHAAGAFTIYHNCGFARSLYANYAEIGMTAWETVAEPPRGDNRLVDAKAALGDRICLVGNIDQVDFLKRATPAEVDARTREIVCAGKPGGRFIFAASDFLEKNTPLANVASMIAAAKDEGRYGA